MEQESDSMTDDRSKARVLSGICADVACNAKLFFPAHDASVECSQCGQRHDTTSLRDVQPVNDLQLAIGQILKSILQIGAGRPKKGPENVKAMGLSNYECKLIGPLLTNYGMDRKTGQARLLRELTSSKRPTFDCSALASKTFLIAPEHLQVSGYGRDCTGSADYLKDTLKAINSATNHDGAITPDQAEFLVPIHADGDGHCLVHAVSRGLVGRELFWHALRSDLKAHLLERAADYKALLGDFMVGDSAEWQDIVDECDVDFIPRDGEALGMRNIHIFGLANVLKRPIILLDSLSGLQSCADYSAVFLPGLHAVEHCKSKDGILNQPLCLGWSSMGHNHYIALVGIKDRRLPRIPVWMLPKVWGLSQTLITQYITKEPDGSVVIGGGKCLQDSYIIQLVKSMEQLFFEKYTVSPALVADVHLHCYKSTGMICISSSEVLRNTVQAVKQKRLYRCLTCEATTLHNIDEAWFKPNGSLYKLAVKANGKLDDTKKYTFTDHGIDCLYDSQNDELVVSNSELKQCTWCEVKQQMRHVRGDGTVCYIDGDRTLTRASSSHCQCGYKHYWDGKEYDNLPDPVPVTLEWGGKTINETVHWFQYESDPSLNSNAFEIAQHLVQKHYPGEFGSERLVQKVVDKIFRLTETKTEHVPEAATSSVASTGRAEKSTQKTTQKADNDKEDFWKSDEASKIILTGFKKTTIHKEELTHSKKERNVQQRIREQAAAVQKRNRTVKTKTVQQNKSLKTDLPLQSTSSNVTDSSTVKTNTAGNNIKIRVSTSDGRQTMLSILVDTTFSELKDRIALEFGINPAQQRIKYGFPPKPMSLADADALPLVNGDRITVEVIADKPTGTIPRDAWPARTEVTQNWSGFDANARERSAQQLLEDLGNIPQGSSNSLDMSIQSLSLMAAIMGKDVWTYVQTMPHLFSVGGLFYNQVKRDLGLVDQKHCTLPVLPGKVFRYNASDDRLELCLEPLGHFQVCPGVEERSKSAPDWSTLAKQADKYESDTREAAAEQTANKLAELQRTLSAGASGVVVNKAMQIPAAMVAFTGEGHSMLSAGQNSPGQNSPGQNSPGQNSPGSPIRKAPPSPRALSSANTHMPTDLQPSPHHGHGNSKYKARSINSPVGRRLSDCTIIEDAEETSMEIDGTDRQRIGPGYSVLPSCSESGELSPEAVTITRHITAGLQTLVEGDEAAGIEDTRSDPLGSFSSAITSDDQEPLHSCLSINLSNITPTPPSKDETMPMSTTPIATTPEAIPMVSTPLATSPAHENVPTVGKMQGLMLPMTTDDDAPSVSNQSSPKQDGTECNMETNSTDNEQNTAENDLESTESEENALHKR